MASSTGGVGESGSGRRLYSQASGPRARTGSDAQAASIHAAQASSPPTTDSRGDEGSARGARQLSGAARGQAGEGVNKGRARQGPRWSGGADNDTSGSRAGASTSRGGASTQPRRGNPRPGPSRTSSSVSAPTPPASSATRRLETYSAEEETLRNDYALHYAVSGEWSGNWVKNANASGERPGEISAEYPRLRRLLDLKRDLLDNYTHPPIYLPFAPFNSTYEHPPDPPHISPPQLNDLATDASHPPTYFPVVPVTPQPFMQLTTPLAQHRFTSILITPRPGTPWARVQTLPIRLISADQAFVFLWVGRADTDGLERGRDLLLKWGFRRCEDIVWVRTNRRALKNRTGPFKGDEVGNGLCVPMKEHCLVGIRGTVRRSTDPWLIHANVDTDVMVWDGPDDEDPDGPSHPPQLYDVIENFCLGTRRLEIFGTRQRARKGWVTVGPEGLDGDAAVPDAGSAVSMVSHLDSAGAPASADDPIARLEAQASSLDLDGDAAMRTAHASLAERRDFEVGDWDSIRYEMYISRLRDAMGRYVLPGSDEIDSLRPKTPPQAGSRAHSGGTTSGPFGQQMQRQNSGLSARPLQRTYANYQPSQNQGPHGQFGANYGNMQMTNHDLMAYANPYTTGPPMGHTNPMMNQIDSFGNMNMMIQQQISQNMALAQMQMMGGYGGGDPQAIAQMMGGGMMWSPGQQHGDATTAWQGGGLQDWQHGFSPEAADGPSNLPYPWAGSNASGHHGHQQSRQWY